MKKIFYVFKVVILLIIIAGSSDALLTIKDPKVVMNGKPVSGATVQVITGSDIKIKKDPPYYSGALLGEYTTNASGVAEFTLAVDSAAQVFLRAWDSSGPRQGGFYGNSGPYSIGLPKDTFRAEDSTITLNLKADRPSTPSIKVVRESLVREPGTDSLKLTLDLTGSGGTEYNADVDVWQIQISNDKGYKDIDAAKNKNVSSSQSPSFSGDYFTGGTSYYANVRTYNVFGWSDLGYLNPEPYVTFAGSATVFTAITTLESITTLEASPITFNPTLYAPSAEKLVINMIAPPKDMQVDDLANIIRAAAKDDNVVIAITHSLPSASGKVFYESYLPGRIQSKSFTIKAGEGVQVFLTKQVDITLTSK